MAAIGVPRRFSPDVGYEGATASTMTACIAVLAAVASGGGLWHPDWYRDNMLVAAGWWGNDLVTLFAAVPALAVSAVLAVRGSRRAALVWLGMLDYVLYNFAFYLFGAALNRFFLLYPALVALSIVTLILVLVRFDVDGLNAGARPRTPVRSIAGLFICVAAALTAVEAVRSSPSWQPGRFRPWLLRPGILRTLSLAST